MEKVLVNAAGIINSILFTAVMTLYPTDLRWTFTELRTTL